jgi:hypothetical protein
MYMYIYDSHPTAWRGLGADNDGRQGFGKRPEVVSPATQSAEVKRLAEEIALLAQRDAWSGVDDAYTKLEDMGDQVFDLIPKGLTTAGAIHALGAQASDALGNTKFKQARLVLAKRSLETMRPIDEKALRLIIESLDTIEKAYGAVAMTPRSMPTSKRQLKRLEGRGPKLIRVTQPGEQLLTSDQLRSIEFAAKVIQEKGSFDGLLPVGSYMLAGQSFTVNAGTELTGKRRTNVLWDN